jgi:hypothetical protein
VLQRQLTRTTQHYPSRRIAARVEDIVDDSGGFVGRAPRRRRMIPLVSICLPNLNTRPFLDERMATILGQTFTD